ncbi:hypothetical protein RhiLY_06475 [Ceratobasidium sp. AG-Ba]|nr:hypothetical protein RhiLY_06475 [Ceratobasidium sp. AG-Ba]
MARQPTATSTAFVPSREPGTTPTHMMTGEKVAVNEPDTLWIHAREGHLLAIQVSLYGGSDYRFPDGVQQRVRTDGLQLVCSEVGLGTTGLDPELGAGPRYD